MKNTSTSTINITCIIYSLKEFVNQEKFYITMKNEVNEMKYNYFIRVKEKKLSKLVHK